jgi:hypothetical protein
MNRVQCYGCSSSSQVRSHILLKMAAPPAVNISGMKEVELRPWQLAQGCSYGRRRFWLDTEGSLQEGQENKEPKHIARRSTKKAPLHSGCAGVAVRRQCRYSVWCLCLPDGGLVDD